MSQFAGRDDILGAHVVFDTLVLSPALKEEVSPKRHNLGAVEPQVGIGIKALIKIPFGCTRHTQGGNPRLTFVFEQEI